jgi:membrane-associated phospholipid phosphatase
MERSPVPSHGRVEGKNHFPTDVLVGAALGNFTARLRQSNQQYAAIWRPRKVLEPLT